MCERVLWRLAHRLLRTGLRCWLTKVPQDLRQGTLSLWRHRYTTTTGRSARGSSHPRLLSRLRRLAGHPRRWLLGLLCGLFSLHGLVNGGQRDSVGVVEQQYERRAALASRCGL